MLATLFQNDENITEEEQQTTAAGGFEQSEEDFDSYYEEQNAYLEPEVTVASGFGQGDNNGGGVKFEVGVSQVSSTQYREIPKLAPQSDHIETDCQLF